VRCPPADSPFSGNRLLVRENTPNIPVYALSCAQGIKAGPATGVFGGKNTVSVGIVIFSLVTANGLRDIANFNLYPNPDPIGGDFNGGRKTVNNLPDVVNPATEVDAVNFVSGSVRRCAFLYKSPHWCC
jgi:hypothetical protein